MASLIKSNAGKVLEGDARRVHPLGTREGDGACPLPVDRIGEDVQPGDLDQQGRVADQGDGSRERPTYWCPNCQAGPAPTGTTRLGDEARPSS